MLKIHREVGILHCLLTQAHVFEAQHTCTLTRLAQLVIPASIIKHYGSTFEVIHVAFRVRKGINIQMLVLSRLLQRELILLEVEQSEEWMYSTGW